MSRGSRWRLIVLWEQENRPRRSVVNGSGWRAAKDSGLDLQMRNGTHFEKSVGCHGIFMAPCSWQAFHSVNAPSFTTQLPELAHDLCPPLLLMIISKVAGYLLMELSNSPWTFWDNGFCSQPSDTLASSWVSVPSSWVESFRDCALQAETYFIEIVES